MRLYRKAVSCLGVAAIAALAVLPANGADLMTEDELRSVTGSNWEGDCCDLQDGCCDGAVVGCVPNPEEDPIECMYIFYVSMLYKCEAITDYKVWNCDDDLELPCGMKTYCGNEPPMPGCDLEDCILYCDLGEGVPLETTYSGCGNDDDWCPEYWAGPSGPSAECDGTESLVDRGEQRYSSVTDALQGGHRNECCPRPVS